MLFNITRSIFRPLFLQRRGEGVEATTRTRPSPAVRNCRGWQREARRNLRPRPLPVQHLRVARLSFALTKDQVKVNPLDLRPSGARHIDAVTGDYIFNKQR